MGIALAAGREGDEVGGAKLLEEARDGAMVGALDQRLAHMRNVEQAGAFAGVQVLGQHAHGIVDRHVVAGESAHARAKLDMESMKRRL